MKKFFFFSAITTFSRMLAGILIIFVLARLFSLNDFGIYTYALVVANLIATFVEYGYNTRLTKELAKDPGIISIYTTQTLILKLLIFIILFIATSSYLLISVSSSIEKQSIFYVVLAIAINSFITHLMIPYKIIDRFDKESQYAVINNVSTFIVVSSVAYISHDVVYTSMSFFIVKLFVLLFLMLQFQNRFSFEFRYFPIIKELKKSTPYALMTILGGMYLSVDTIVIKQFLTMEDIGIYRAGINIVLASAVIINIINNVALPKLASYYQRREELINISSKFNRFVIAIGIGISIFIYIMRDILVQIMYGNDFETLVSFMPYIVAILFLRYLGSIYGLLLTIADKQTLRVVCVGLTLVLIVITDLILVPSIGLKGAFIGIFLGHILLISLYIGFSLKEHGSFLIMRR